MADINQINLSLDKINVESTSISIVREYLARKGYKETLKKLDEECPRDEKSLNSRSKILEYLKINKLQDANKKLKEPYPAVLEVILSYMVVNDILVKSHSFNIKAIQVQEKLADRKMGNKQFENDLQIDEAEDGELTDGTEKRLKNTEKEVEINNKRILNSNTSKKLPAREAVAKKEKKKAEYEDDFEDEKGDYHIKESSLGLKVKEDEEAKKKNLLDDLFGSIGKETESSEKFERGKSLKQHDKSSMKEDEQEIVLKKSVDQTDKSKVHKNASDDLSTANNNNLLTKSSNNSNLLNAIKKDYQTIPIDYQTATGLKNLIFGSPNIVFNDEWKYQSFSFCDIVKLKYGFIQKKGGPCGVLASVQAHFLLEFLFSNDANPKTSFDINKRDRSKTLAIAISKLLWKCGEENNEAFICVPSSKAHFAPVGKYRSDGITETLNLLQFNNYKSLEEYLLKNVSIYENEDNFGVVLLLYAAIFSRTIKKIQLDMDEPTNKLMGQHFYCTQEMVNLLIHGKAYSNVFNDTVMLDSLKLKGPEKRNEIGLLSLFEHYKSCEVGSYYKTPKYPIWVICSESHFSVLFSLKKEILSDWKAESKFDLYYYDGLARQEEQIRLTIDCSTHGNMFVRPKVKTDKKVELVPPLEFVIQTKWKDAVIDWNGYEPIL